MRGKGLSRVGTPLLRLALIQSCALRGGRGPLSPSKGRMGGHWSSVRTECSVSLSDCERVAPISSSTRRVITTACESAHQRLSQADPSSRGPQIHHQCIPHSLCSRLRACLVLQSAAHLTQHCYLITDLLQPPSRDSSDDPELESRLPSACGTAKHGSAAAHRRP